MVLNPLFREFRSLDWAAALPLRRDSSTGTAAYTAWLAMLAVKSKLAQTFATSKYLSVLLDNITAFAIISA
jgi:hypothetical protein